MLGESKVSGMIPVSDYDRAKQFYGETLGMDVMEVMPGMVAFLKSGDGMVSMYQTADNAGKSPATVAGFAVGDIRAIVKQLKEAGISTERYEGFEMDEDGITTGEGPPAAWFKDPDGNILSLFQGA